MRRFLSGKKEHKVFNSFMVKEYKTFFRNLGVFLLLVVLGFILYGQTLSAPFFFDDHKMIVENWAIRNLRQIHEIWRVVDYPRLCFLTFVSFAINYHFGGYDPFGYHLVNIVLHSINAFLLYHLLLALLNFWARTKNGGLEHQHFMGFMASLIFLVHPIQTQSVSFVWSRTEVFSAFFGFLSIWLYIRGRMNKGLSNFLFSGMLFLSGVFCRGNILILPLLIILIEISFGGCSINGLRQRLKGYWYLWAIGFLLLVAGAIRLTPTMIGLLRLEAVVPVSWVSVKMYFFTQLKVVVRYLQLLFLPIHQNVDHYILFSESIFDIRTFLSLIIILSVLGSVCLLFNRNRLMAFGLLWFFISLIPVSTVFVLSTLISESRLYFPSAGFAIFLSGFLFLINFSPKTRRHIAIALIVILSFLTFNRNSLWHSPIKLMEDSVARSPQYYRPHLVLGTLYAKEERFKEAADMFQRATELQPDYLPPYNNLAIIYMLQGEFETARKLYRKILNIDPNYYQGYLNLGYVYIHQKKWWLAKDIFLKGLAQCGSRPEIYIGLADCYILRGNFDDELLSNGAKESLKKALELDPGNKRALSRLGQVYFMRHEFKEASRIFNNLLQADPKDIDANIQMARVYIIQNQWEQAENILVNALRLAPRHIQIYEMLAQVYFAIKDFKKAEEFYQKANQLFVERKFSGEKNKKKFPEMY